MIVGKAIYYLLTNATDVTDVVSTRIYPEIAQQDADLPYIVYAIANNEPTDTKPEPSKLDTAQVEVNIYAESYTECIDLAVAVRAALDRVKGTYNGVNVQSIQYLNEVIDFDEPQRAYNINADYDVRISRSGFEIAQGSPITGVQLGELSDVDVTGVTNGQLIAYNDATGNWEAANDAGGAEELNDLTDVNLSLPADGEVLKYDGGEWVNDNVAISNVTGLQSELNTIPDGLDDLDDVKIIGTPSEGDALVYQSGFFSLGTAGASTLGDLTDVNTTGAGVGSLIQFNGSSWDISAAELPDDAVYYHNRYASEAETLLDGATATVELYYTAQADGDGLHEDAQTDTAQSGYDIQRKLYYAEKAQADPDTSGNWTQFTAIADNTTFANAKAALLAYLKERTGGTVPISLKMTWEEVAQAPAFTGLLNESYGSGAEAAYSTRRLNGNYSGDCMTIRRASDGTTQSIGFVGEEIDESAIETFCSGTTCTVQVWRDQSGNGYDAEQTTTANQPTIYTGGALVKEGGRLAINFDGSNDSLKYTGNFFGGSAASGFSVSSFDNATRAAREIIYGLQDSTNARYDFLLTRQTSTPPVGTTANGIDFYVEGDFQTGTTHTITDSNQHLLTAIYSDTVKRDIFDGGSLAHSYSNFNLGTLTDGTDFLIGEDINGGNGIDGNIQEIVIYNSDKSTDRTDIEGNISAYFQSAKLLDEQYGAGAEAAYSTRQLRRNQTECMVIRRASDSTTTTIGFVDGDIDEAAIETFCTGTTCTVVTWKDQSGNGNDATAAAEANEPTIYTGGALVKENGRVAVDFASNRLQANVSGTLTAQTVAVVATTGSAASWQRILSQSTSSQEDSLNYIPVLRNSSTNLITGRDGGNKGGLMPIIYGEQFLFSALNTGSALTNFLNGTSNTTTNYSFSESVDLLSLGNGTTTSDDRPLNGVIQEAVVYHSAKSTTDLNSIESNIGDYFTQNTPLLDTYSGAAAAYSLRLLDSTYTGALINVWNGTSYADIYPNVFGELDTVALAAHCGSNDGFIRYWYDQSSNSNDATQTTTANMPKIYDGTTGVVTQNGKVALQFDGSNDHLLPSQGSSYNVGTLFGVHDNNAASSRVGGQDYLENSFWMDTTTQMYFRNRGGTITINNTDQFKNWYFLINGTDTSEAAINGATATTAIFGNLGVQDRIGIGRQQASYFNGYFYELILYKSNESDNRTGIEDNINTFYSIY